MYDFILALKEDTEYEIEARKKEEEAKKPKENFYTKKYTYSSMLFAALIAGPLIGLAELGFIWMLFFK